MQLRVEGGEVLDKIGKNLDDYNLRKDCVLLLEKAEKIRTRGRKTKEAAKMTVNYVLRENANIASSVDVPKSTRVR